MKSHWIIFNPNIPIPWFLVDLCKLYPTFLVKLYPTSPSQQFNIPQLLPLLQRCRCSRCTWEGLIPQGFHHSTAVVNAGDRGHTQLRGLGGETAQGPWRMVFLGFSQGLSVFWGGNSVAWLVCLVFLFGDVHMCFLIFGQWSKMFCVFFCCFPQFVLRYTILRKLVVSILGWAFPKIVIFNTVFRNKMASVFDALWLPLLILSSHLSDLKAARAAPRLTMRLSSSTAVAPLPTIALSGAGSCLRFRT